MQCNWRIKSFRLFSIWCFTLLLVGCVDSQPFMAKNKLLIATQTPNGHLEQEIMIARISQVLQIGGMDKKDRASLHFERGVLYDALGLWGLARYDFLQSLIFQPKNAALYNYLGVYQLINENYDEALEAFNVALEFNPKDEYSLFNRGLGFYYIARYPLAQQDFWQFYQQDQSDAYRALWLYLNELEINPKKAKQQLAQQASALSQKQWGSYIVQYYLGQLSLAELQQQGREFAETQKIPYAEVLTETYFYLAKQQLNLGQKEKAENLFKLTIANQVYNFVEYRFAVLELAKLKRQQAK
ncbi:lipoprotein NlpI [Avibacterium sp. 21-599]|uniref:lipoprotein NlpI n=1 Tax=Avibacterium sp. 21-599 TaxID=2911528 RepID=UPI00224584EF|nr:lipoprotein NlpI [Avibacterium sp. 21-599]MCW9717456.1 lipoprotein NlpI [Avibacterium sp. 21-599]